MKIKNLIKTFAIVGVSFLAVNGVSALSPSVLEAIQGLPLGEQVTFIATELDNVKREQACQKAETLKQQALNLSGIIDADSASNLDARLSQVQSLVPERLPDFMPFYNQYKTAIAECSQP